MGESPPLTKTNLYEKSIYPHADSNKISWISATAWRNVLVPVYKFSGSPSRAGSIAHSKTLAVAGVSGMSTSNGVTTDADGKHFMHLSIEENKLNQI